jgi:hypothetical protein
MGWRRRLIPGTKVVVVIAVVVVACAILYLFAESQAQSILRNVSRGV